jgi:hypothetical protein
VEVMGYREGHAALILLCGHGVVEPVVKKAQLSRPQDMYIQI